MTSVPFDMPVLSEEKANAILDDIAQTVLQLREEDGSDLVLPTPDKLARIFGPTAPVVAQMVFQAAIRAFEAGVVEQLPAGDRTDVLVAALRRVHAPEMFGDCAEDGEHFPCKTARALDLVAGSSDPDDTFVAEESTTLRPE